MATVLHWHFQETRSFLSCNYLGIGSRAKLRLKGLFLLGGKIALTAIRSRINRTLIKTNRKAENNMLEVRKSHLQRAATVMSDGEGFPSKKEEGGEALHRRLQGNLTVAFHVTGSILVKSTSPPKLCLHSRCTNDSRQLQS